MSFCKICKNCGYIIIFQKRLICPENCPECGNWIGDSPMYNEDDPNLELEQKKWTKKKEQTINHCTLRLYDGSEISLPPKECANCSAYVQWIEEYALAEKKLKNIQERRYVLQMVNGQEIEIPQGGCIIGRSETGAEKLADCLSVSRQHLRAIPRSQGLILEDLSRYGTFVDGERIQRTLVKEGSKITLGDTETVLVIKERE